MRVWVKGGPATGWRARTNVELRQGCDLSQEEFIRRATWLRTQTLQYLRKHKGRYRKFTPKAALGEDA